MISNNNVLLKNFSQPLVEWVTDQSLNLIYLKSELFNKSYFKNSLIAPFFYNVISINIKHFQQILDYIEKLNLIGKTIGWTIIWNNDKIIKITNQKTMSKIDKRGNFLKYANKRLSNCVLSLKRLGNLANRSYYEYKDTDQKIIFKILKNEIDELKRKFEQSSKQKNNKEQQNYFE